jgi:hypothetical protein
MTTKREVYSIIYNFRKREKILKQNIEELQKKLKVYQQRPINDSIDNGNTIIWISEGDLLFIILCVIVILFSTLFFIN